MSSPVTGEWMCGGCGFLLQTRFLNPTNGATGVDERLGRYECPNDGKLLVQVTEADVIDRLRTANDSLFEDRMLFRGALEKIAQMPHGATENLAVTTAQDALDTRP